MFDDWVNLGSLQNNPQLNLSQRALIFITREGTTFLARPLSLLSFYLNDISWPSNPEGFRYTNISIHALNSILIFWLTLRILHLSHSKILHDHNYIIAAAVALMWALHPIHVNSVAYVIQRMTLLSATFVLGGVITYTYGRELIHQQIIRKGLIYMSLAIILFLPLAFFCKQNGVLLPLFILIIEHTLFSKPKEKKIVRSWSIPFLALPIIAVVSALIYKAHEKVFSWYDALTYTPAERLMTESRILFDYLNTIILPKARTSSLFHDNFPISHSLTDPISTLPAIVLILIAFFIAIYKRQKWPFLSFAILWFLAGHLLESSIIGLELYYEHRNYIPSYGIILAIAVSAGTLLINKKIILSSLAIMYLSLFVFVTQMNTSIWGNKAELISNWYTENPGSLRTANAMTGLLQQIGKYEDARKVIINAENNWPNSPEPPLFLLLLDCVNNNVSANAIQRTINAIPREYDHSNIALDIVEKLHKQIKRNNCPPLKLEDLTAIILHLLENSNTKNKDASAKWKIVTHNLYFWLARIASEQGDLNKAMQYADAANNVKPSVSLKTLQAFWLASAGLNKEALVFAREALQLSDRLALIKYANPQREKIINLINTLKSKQQENQSSENNRPLN